MCYDDLMILFVLILGILPGFAWLVFYLKEEETHRESKRLIFFAFAAGMAFGLIAVILENLLNTAGAGIGIAELSILGLVIFALIEEAAKFGAAYLTIGRSKVMHDPLDIMIYLVVAALGFATLENIGSLASFWIATRGMGVTSSFAGSFAETLSLRFVGATLLHSLTSGIVGYHWAVGVLRHKVARYLPLGLAIGTVLHAFFNLLILNYGNIAYALVFLTLLGFFVLNDFEKLKAVERSIK
jgi:RsiW-degrading membrane proteinase PrsW (M82 family)